MSVQMVTSSKTTKPTSPPMANDRILPQHWVRAAIALAGMFLLNCGDEGYKFTLQLNIAPRDEVRAINSDGSTLLITGVTQTSLVKQGLTMQDIEPIVLQLFVGPSFKSQQTFFPYQCRMLCEGRGCNPNDIVEETITLGAASAAPPPRGPWVESNLSCTLASGKVYSEVY
jgi:hypothetical protein